MSRYVKGAGRIFRVVVLCLFVLAAKGIKVEAKPLGNPAIYNGVDYSAIYNKGYYRALNQEAFRFDEMFGEAYDKANDTEYIEHFLNVGMPLGVSASPDFDVKLYMENNPDLVAVYGVDSYVPYYEHYMNQGKAEGRIAKRQNTENKIVSTCLLKSTGRDCYNIEIYQDDGSYKQINGGGLLPRYGYKNGMTEKVLNSFIMASDVLGTYTFRPMSEYVDESWFDKMNEVLAGKGAGFTISRGDYLLHKHPETRYLYYFGTSEPYSPSWMTSMGSVMRYNQTTKEWEELCMFNMETKRIKVIG